MTSRTSSRIRRFIQTNCVQDTIFSLSRLPLSACTWPAPPNGILSLGEQPVTVVVVGTVASVKSNSGYGHLLPASHCIRLELARNNDYPIYADVLRRWAYIEPRIPAFFEAWAYANNQEPPQHHPPIVPQLYLSLQRIGYGSQIITFADLRVHDVVRLEAAICRGVVRSVYFHVKRLDVLERPPYNIPGFYS
ncbi:hypothetical protein L227DRAFT_613193 [Lentinus tigrinus ALCF2SS1-6]|uniref:Uncharacterized protein n=1 Tax=Lentinus tigrinus ALCF2SS1-6 TaxID=1328759 RepID=A0A5C2S3R9_9APHY|nr:hypothetical protein L227DRAFT_613193 [Lentinus tigrinus ALCF2SS1-6]